VKGGKIVDRRKQIKQELGERYVFERQLSVREAKNLLRQDAKKISPQVVQSLTAGCVKIELCVYAQNGKPRLGYDVFVKDSPDSPEWICFDSPDDPGSFDEEEMFDVLDRVVEDDHLSYTECCFEKLYGKRIEKKTAKAAPGDRDRP
jgi:hypothetical protein